MQLAFWDIVVIGGYFVVSLVIGLWFSRKAGKSTENFFLGGRNMPWWLAGISMVATTFAADTPLAVTELVAKNGISGNWLWWNMLIGGMLTVFFFAKLWRKAGILTDLELIELRYAGPVARYLRAFRAVYLGLLINALIIGWVNLALISLLEVFFEMPFMQAFWLTMAIMAAVSVYTSLSGLIGVAATDVLQFVLAMSGTITLAILVLSSEQVGGVAGLKAQLPSAALSFLPQLDAGDGLAETLTLGWGSLLAYAGMQWWASWYPGAEPGGGGYVAQRMMSAKNERHAFWATFLFQAAHYCLRPWPWILAALCTLILYPDLEDPRLGYVMLMRDFLPVGLKGLLFAAFLAAYMSTVSTQLNWGAGYLINDFYFRFFEAQADEKRRVWISRVATLLIMLITAGVTSQLESISAVWRFIIECGAGLGLVLILRWYWWRINASAELAATVAPFFFYGLAKLLPVLSSAAWATSLSQFPNSFFLTVGGTTITWLLVMYTTKPEKEATLRHFMERVGPMGAWPDNLQHLKGSSIPLSILATAWLLSILALYSLLFSIGKLLLGTVYEFLSLSAVCILATFSLVLINRQYRIF